MNKTINNVYSSSIEKSAIKFQEKKLNLTEISKYNSKENEINPELLYILNQNNKNEINKKNSNIDSTDITNTNAINNNIMKINYSTIKKSKEKFFSDDSLINLKEIKTFKVNNILNSRKKI